MSEPSLLKKFNFLYLWDPYSTFLIVEKRVNNLTLLNFIIVSIFFLSHNLTVFFFLLQLEK